MKIVITGGTGFIGRHLVEYWKGSGYTITVMARHINPSLFSVPVQCMVIDITDKIAIQTAIVSLQPDVIIHTAALSKPNDCEGDQAACFDTNVAATQYIIEACTVTQAKLIFLSTDFVFSHNGPHKETDKGKPVNYYGESKRLAEEAIRASGTAYAIVRTGLVVGPKLMGQANTFLHWVQQNGAAGNTIQLYTDQQRSPTFVTDLCRGIEAIIQTTFAGTIHLSGNDVATPYSLAQQVAQYCGFDQQLLLPTTYAQRPEPARRPQNAVLCIEKARQVLGYTTTPINEMLKAVFEPE
jgi:dTDP-4-dehydrorhamnose reductase